MKHLAHWDEVEAVRREEGHLAGTWRDLGDAAGTWMVGLQRIEIDPGKWATPAHAELVEEEIFYVLGGSGLAWMDGQAYEVAARSGSPWRSGFSSGCARTTSCCPCRSSSSGMRAT